jgi:hypothetical protein
MVVVEAVVVEVRISLVAVQQELLQQHPDKQELKAV